jgi:hypothetical protein
MSGFLKKSLRVIKGILIFCGLYFGVVIMGTQITAKDAKDLVDHTKIFLIGSWCSMVSSDSEMQYHCMSGVFSKGESQ